MARLEKLKASFKACRGPYSWQDFETMLLGLGYAPVKAGKTSGSARRYHKPATGHIVMLHKPHGGEMAPGMVKRLQAELTEKGEI